MEKTFINNAVIGNSSLLACLTDKGELVRFFWPNIDYPQHVDRFAAGIYFTHEKNSTVWIGTDAFGYTQRYIGDTNILETVCTSYERGLKAIQTDYALPDNDILVRQYDITNIGPYETELGFIIYSSVISTNPNMNNSLFDFKYDALIHYRHNYYVSISADRVSTGFQLGNNAFESASRTELYGYDSIGMTPEGAVSWSLGRFLPGETKQINLYICAGHTIKDVKKLINYTKQSDAGEFYDIAQAYWEDFLEKAKLINTGNAEIDAIYKRSILVFKLMADKKSGGLLAAPEIDEFFKRCGRYAYCWGRDAAFITNALDKAGLTETVDKFYEWAVSVQDEEGFWHQRYHLDGNLAPSWGIQVDETGTLVWGMLQHYKHTQNKDFLLRIWNSAKSAVEFLCGFIDKDTGLPKPSFDLWEERFGEHTYSSAAVYGGITAGVEIAGILDKDELLIESWTKAAELIKEAIIKNMWKEDRKCFIRSIRTKLNPWGAEPSEHTVLIEFNPKGYKRDVTLEDGMVDISLLGTAVPFEVFHENDPMVEGTVKAIESVLTAHNGGIRRYEWDNYIGGNPWVLTTLWVALYHIKVKDYDRAKQYFEWAVKSHTELYLLPEQVNKDTGRPEWVIPLTWSHAMFVLVLIELFEAGKL